MVDFITQLQQRNGRRLCLLSCPASTSALSRKALVPDTYILNASSIVVLACSHSLE